MEIWRTTRPKVTCFHFTAGLSAHHYFIPPFLSAGSDVSSSLCAASHVCVRVSRWPHTSCLCQNLESVEFLTEFLVICNSFCSLVIHLFTHMDKNIQRFPFVSNNGENELVYVYIDSRNVFMYPASKLLLLFNTLQLHLSINLRLSLFTWWLRHCVIRFLIIFKSPELHVCKRFDIL